MKAEELRIGNWVNSKGGPQQIYHLDMGSHTFYRINDLRIHKETGRLLETHEEIFSSIPLTPEILEKCDAKYHHLDIGCEDPKDAYWSVGEMNFAIDNISWRVQGLNITVPYLHQLQNLYFCLTGKELEVNL